MTLPAAHTDGMSVQRDLSPTGSRRKGTREDPCRPDRIVGRGDSFTSFTGLGGVLYFCHFGMTRQ